MKSALYRDPQMLDPVAHRHKRIKPLTDYSVTNEMHAVFIAATEFPAAALSFPIIFVQTGERLPDGKAMVAPVAMLGIAANENLHLDGSRWDADYIPAFIRRYPMLTAGIQGSDEPAVFVDAAWPGFNDNEGERLFEDDGQHAPALQRALDFLRQFDAELQRTRQFCVRLLELDLLSEVTLDGTLPSGEVLKVNGFLTIEEERLAALPDAVVLELHRNGMLMLMQVHLVSLGKVKQLLERKALRMAAAQTAVTA